MTLGAGEQFAGYTIIRPIGSGSMGQVYLAQHPRLPRREALKILLREISTDPSFRQRFIREADSIAALEHPNIVTVYDRGDEGGTLWIATQYVDGTDAAQLLREHHTGGLPLADVAAITTAIAQALDYAHSRGLVHRDVKPANILLSSPDEDDERRAYLADFGIARPLDDPSGLTATNFTFGTFAYAAPEQLMGQSIDGRADQYALAATTYHLLTGAMLFPDSNQIAVISQHLTQPPPRPSAVRPELAAFDAALARALAKNPDDRFPRCRDFAQAIAAAARDTAAYAPTQQAPIQTRSDDPAVAAASAPTQMAASGEMPDFGQPPPVWAPPPGGYRGAPVGTPTTDDTGPTYPPKTQHWWGRRGVLAAGAAAAAAAVVALIATNQQTPSPTPTQLTREGLPAPSALVQQSLTTMRALHSAHLEQTTKGSLDNWPVNTLAGDITNRPSNAFSGVANMKLGGQVVDAELVVLDSLLYAAITPNNWLDMGPAAETFDPSAYLDPNNGLVNALTGITDPKSQEFEAIDGVSTVRVSGMLPADAANKLFPQARARAPLPVNVWIKKDAPNELVQTQLQPDIGSSITWTLSQWGKPVTVSKPAGAT
jgi:serine/threonine protein kinase